MAAAADCDDDDVGSANRVEDLWLGHEQCIAGREQLHREWAEVWADEGPRRGIHSHPLGI